MIWSGCVVVFKVIGLYWELGKRIAEQQEAAGWGDAVIGHVAQDLTRELGGLKGFSRANLLVAQCPGSPDRQSSFRSPGRKNRDR